MNAETVTASRMEETFAPLPKLTRKRRWRERPIEFLLFVAAFSSVAITAGIVFILVFESVAFFKHVSLKDFLTDRLWTPLFADAHYGILPLVAGTLVTTGVALAVALPIGTIVAIYLSEFAPFRLREIIKPALELLSAVPTVIYGYFALGFVAPILQKLVPGLPLFSMLSAGIVMGIMIIPYVSSLSEDAMRAVPMLLREGSYALGASRLGTAVKVVFPAALSGIGAAYILGISRAIGETMIVAIAAGMQPNLTWNPTEPAATITAYIVQVSLGDLPHGSIGYQSIFAAGLTLFVMTLMFNIGGHVLRKKFREAY
ncbi:MAG: phosphate ABC transporter permease subunit PstC [Verrucomicrobia bacterium SCN 57-15]|nr:MAG: phosphate ABC transporter permease subunit PstC [Verrucomicrobia bacterium SCN 57-15]